MSKILRNTSYLLIAQVSTKFISFFYVLYLARSLGVNNFGIYSVALSYFSLMSTFTDLGFSRYLTREVSKNKDNLSRIFPNVLFFRFLISILIFVLFSLVVFIFDPDKLRSSLVTIIGLALLPQSIGLTIDSLFIGLHKIKFTALGILVLNLSTAIFGTLLVKNNFGVTGATVAIILGQVFYALVFILIFSREKINVFNNINFRLFGSIIRGSVIYGFLAVLGLIYFKVDTILLSYIKGAYDTGIYSAAYKFIEAVTFIPTALAVVLFPVFSNLNEGNVQQIKPLIKKIFIYMGSLGILTTLCFIVILPIFIRFFLPAYLPSIAAVQILALAIPFMFIHVPLSQVLLSTEKYIKPIFLISVFTMSFNLITNLIFIPVYGYFAAAVITVLSDVLSLIVLTAAIKKFIYK